jgi:flagellar biogenesis protein FliO
MKGNAAMNLMMRTLGLILLATCAAPVSAQVASYSTPANDVRWTSYEQPSDTKVASPVPLPPHTADHPETDKRSNGIQSVVQVVGSLAAVLGAFFLIVWLLRRASPQRTGLLPSEAFEVLGRAPLANHQQAQLIRCGSKLLLVAVGGTGAGATTTLTEITEPDEVDRLVVLCRQPKGGAPSAGFRQVLRQVEGRRG